jgi:hypothetical protein
MNASSIVQIANPFGFGKGRNGWKLKLGIFQGSEYILAEPILMKLPEKRYIPTSLRELRGFTLKYNLNNKVTI